MTDLQLDSGTVTELLDLLSPIVTGAKKCKTLLLLTFGTNASVTRDIDLTGSPSDIIIEMIRKLASSGKDESGKQPLWLLLEQVREQRGLDQDTQIDRLQSLIDPPSVTPNTILLSAPGDPVVREYCEVTKKLIRAEFSNKWHALDRRDIYPAGPPHIHLCHDDVLACGLYIGILGHFYGTVDAELDLSYTEYEFQVAKDSQKKIAVFIFSDDVEFRITPEEFKIQGPLAPRQEAFCARVQSVEGIFVERISSTSDFEKKLCEYLRQLEQPTGIVTSVPVVPKSKPFLGEHPHLNYDRRPVMTCALNDLDSELIDFFLKQDEALTKLGQLGLLRATREEQLKSLQAFHNEGPTVGAFLCFAPYHLLRDKFAACSLQMVVYSDTRRAVSRASPEIIGDNLINLFDIGMNFLTTNSGLQRTGQIGTSERDDLEIPKIALREALANAIVHRDYEKSVFKDQPTRIEVYPDRVEITSFGGLPEGISEDALNKDPESVVPIRRNHIIAEIFRIMQNVELNASGISRMHEATQRANLPLPEIIQKSGLPTVKVIFRRGPSSDRLQQFARVRLQDLRDFTVQIRRLTDDKTVGTGVAVSTDGKVVTCAHVAQAALGRHPRQAKGKEIGVYFPQARGGEEKARRATVAVCFPQHDDNVVLLQLVDGPAPLAPEQIAVLGTAGASRGHEFQSYGYSRIDNYPAIYAAGRIVGPIERPTDRLLQADPIQLQSRQLNRGMSGAAVLDEERNLVVGIVSERAFPTTPVKDDIGYAVDACVLTFDPINFPLRDAPLPKRAAPQPKTDVEAARAAVAPDLGMALHGASPPLTEWVGRDDLLKSITRDWADPNLSVTGLIGFGGEGKSSLARRWLDNLLASTSPPPTLGEGPGEGARPDGIFWWGFYDRPSVDEFFEAALKYMGGGRIDPRRMPSANVRAQIIGAMLGAGRYLFVLDGLEVMQHQEGDQYGLLKSADLREFLSYFAAPEHQSFCLVTSRAPLLDLMAYTTYTHRDVTRLSQADGVALLREVGVVGQFDKLSNVVEDWDGHALTLGLLGGQLASQYGGDVARASEIDPPTAGEPRYERVHRVLRRYDEHLTEAERDFLTLFSAFRTPVHESAFDKVFHTPTSPPTLGEPALSLSKGTEGGLVQRLLTYRILRHDPHTSTYTSHPLIRNHYFARLTAGGREEAQDAHERIKDYYLELAGDTPRYPTLDDLAPLIEAVHHACRAGTYDEGFRILQERINQRDRYVLTHQLGAYEALLMLMVEFFPDGDTSQEPQVSNLNKSYVLNQVGLCLMSLGRLGEALSFFEREKAIALGMEDWRSASIGYQNMASLHIHLGALTESADAAREALALARRAENKGNEMISLAYQVWGAHLRGDPEAAGAAFQQAEALEREIDSDARYLYSLRGIQHADHLRRTGNPAYARRVTEANLEICERNRWTNQISWCHRVLGDLDADAGQHESTRAHYDEALKIARSITFRPALIEALLARGRGAARRACQTSEVWETSEVSAAFSDLNEALGYAVDGGYRIYEADARIGLAWAHLAAGDSSAGRAEAERAQQMSVQMGYHWGQVDAAEVLAALAGTNDLPESSKSSCVRQNRLKTARFAREVSL